MKRSEVTAAQETVRRQLADAGIVLAPDVPIEVADFGLGDWERRGLGIVVRVNEAEYCSKFLTLRPGQECPAHSHKVKKETFFALSGTVWLRVDGRDVVLSPGERFTLRPGMTHAFGSVAGAVVEEVSTHDENADSYFDDPAIVRDPVIEED
jgi:D-lyxose ketol-isomerase